MNAQSLFCQEKADIHFFSGHFCGFTAAEEKKKKGAFMVSLQSDI